MTDTSIHLSKPDPVAIIDLGSNSVRMVVFKETKPLTSDKVQCLLGRDLLKTGKLNPKACDKVRKTLKKFMTLVKKMNVKTILPIGTAALRSASDGKDFINSLEREFGFSVRLISGQEEARLSALGVLTLMPNASGVVADLGGGSLELACIGNGAVSEALSMPMGALILSDYGKNLPFILRETFQNLPDSLKKQDTLYVVGGTLRCMARINMKLHKDKVDLQGYTVSRRDIQSLCEYVRKKSPGFLAKKYDISAVRARTLSPASFLVEALMDELSLSEMVVSLGGLRDGILREYYTSH
ncbi:MAG: hypothetical protein KDI61_07115 [Alphaproteobacteria bacterium]|nr:hypothetical protein [Alphaproteobacteria bacterium]MCB1840013.1 hypothetical protein [Alphaproteobacteria bacterium]